MHQFWNTQRAHLILLQDGAKRNRVLGGIGEGEKEIRNTFAIIALQEN
jgi:hypothetical protein